MDVACDRNMGDDGDLQHLNGDGPYNGRAMAMNTSDFKNGMAIDLGSDGLFQINEFQHVKPGKGGAFVRTTLRNMRTGAVVDRTFRAGERMERAFIEKRDQQFLYKDQDGFVVMDAESYEQLTVPEETMGDAGNYLREGDTITIQFYGDEIVGSDMPAAVELTITETEPGLQGDRVSGARKAATLETGLVIQVPLFVDQGDVVKVDTRSGEYITRA